MPGGGVRVIPTRVAWPDYVIVYLPSNAGPKYLGFTQMPLTTLTDRGIVSSRWLPDGKIVWRESVTSYFGAGAATPSNGSRPGPAEWGRCRNLLGWIAARTRVMGPDLGPITRVGSALPRRPFGHSPLFADSAAVGAGSTARDRLIRSGGIRRSWCRVNRPRPPATV